jgi:hypothetical protein
VTTTVFSFWLISCSVSCFSSDNWARKRSHTGGPNAFAFFLMGSCGGSAYFCMSPARDEALSFLFTGATSGARAPNRFAAPCGTHLWCIDLGRRGFGRLAWDPGDRTLTDFATASRSGNHPSSSSCGAGIALRHFLLVSEAYFLRERANQLKVYVTDPFSVVICARTMLAQGLCRLIMSPVPSVVGSVGLPVTG